MARLQVLSYSEIKSFETPPEFNNHERKNYFRISESIQENLDNIRTDINKVCFILQSGYFKATSKFFAPRKFHFKDLAFVCEQLNIKPNEINLEDYLKNSFLRHQVIILEIAGFKQFDETAKGKLITEARFLTYKQLKPRHIFLSLIDFLIAKRIEIPAFNTLSSIIIQALNEYESKLLTILENKLTEEHKNLLDTLIEKEDTKIDSKKNYKFTFLKKFNHSVRPGQIKENIDQLQPLADMYNKLEDISRELKLSETLTEYYATWVIKSKSSQILQKDEPKRNLYLIAFINHQYRIIQDMLIDKILLCVQKALNTAKEDYKRILYENRQERCDKSSKIYSYSRRQKSFKKQIIDIIENDAITIEDMINMIKMITYSNSSQKEDVEIDILLTEMEEDNAKLSKDIYLYNSLESISAWLQARMSYTIKNIDFNEYTSEEKLILAINYFKKTDGKLGNNAPLDFIKKDAEKNTIIDDNGKLKISLYKILLFRDIAHAIKAGTLNLKHSYRYKSFEEYLISKEYWENNKEELLERADLKEFVNIKSLINQYKEYLDQQYKLTNKNILTKDNRYISFDSNAEYKINTPKKDTLEESNLSEIFPQQKFIPLVEILRTVEKSTNFLKSFEHHVDKYTREKQSDAVFYASIMGYGCNIGINKMSKISHGINKNELETVSNWYFSSDTVHNANNRILDFVRKLDIRKASKKDPDQTHTSSDGQKFAVTKDSVMANYSFKYFGKGKGVSLYNFIDDSQISFYSTVINSSEREAAYVIDGLMHNDVVKSDIHSTDTHGYSELIFGATHLLGFYFAPRIKNVSRQQIYSFDPNYRKAYLSEGYNILPDRYVKTEVIEENWDDILRFITTIKLKETTASQLFKRLNSYSKENPIYRGLKAFGQIHKTLFILRYINEVEFRQDIEGELNKVENSNKFSKVVMVGNNTEIDYQTKEDLDKATSCTRLIKNAIICWNYMYLTNLLTATEDKEQREQILKSLKNGSILIWHHINFNGEYNFLAEDEKNSINFNISEILTFKCV